MKIEGAAHPFPFPIKERLPSYPRMFFPLPSEKTIRGRGKQNERGVSCCFPTTFSPQKGTFPLFPTFFLLSFCTLRFPLRKWDVSHWEKETMMTIRKKDHLPVFSDLSAASFPFTSQIEGKQKKGRIPFPTFPSSFLVLSMFFGIALFFSKEKRNFPLNFMFPFLRCLFHSRSKRRGCLLCFLASFLAILFSFLFSLGAYILMKNVKVVGASLSLSLFWGNSQLQGALSPCLSSFLIHRERRKKMKN